jgi:transcriptional regulator with XRE-family HTH domain
MTRGNPITARPVVRRMARDAEHLRDHTPSAERLQNVIDGHGKHFARTPSDTQALIRFDGLRGEQESLRDVSTLEGENDPPMVRDLKQEVANRLVVIRAELKLSQTGMARYLNVDRARYWHWEGFATNKPAKPPPKRARAAKAPAKPKKPAKPKTAAQKAREEQGNLPAIDVMILLSEKTGITLDYIYKGQPAGLSLAMAIRLEARALGLDPDDPEFHSPAGQKALRAKAGL